MATMYAQPTSRTRSYFGEAGGRGSYDPNSRYQFRPNDRIAQDQYGSGPGYVQSQEDYAWGQMQQPQQSQQQQPFNLGALGGADAGLGNLNLPQFNLPTFSLPGTQGMSFGGGTQISKDGGITMTAPDTTGAYQSYLDTIKGLGTAGIGAQSEAYGNLLGLTGQLGTANINAGLGRYQADQGLAATGLQTDAARFAAEKDYLARELAAQLGLEGQKEQYGAQRYVSDQERAAAELASNNQLQAALAQAAASTRPAELEYQRFTDAMPFFQQLATQLMGGNQGSQLGGDVGGGQLPQLAQQQMLNQAMSGNAAMEAAALRGAGAGAPGTGAASQRAGLQRAMADTAAGYQIPAAANEEDIRNRLALIAAANDRMRAQTSAISPFLSMLGG